MARYKTIDTSPRFLAGDLEKQLLPGSFEHGIHYLIDHDFDLSGFDRCYRNDVTGASAYPLGMLLKVVLFAHSQVIVAAQAHGTGSEQALLLPLVDAARPLMQPQTLITADAGYHSEANLARSADLGVEALIADPGMRSRDERFQGQGQHKTRPDPLHNKAKPVRKSPLYRPQDFRYDPVAGTCICPAGQSLYSNGAAARTLGGRTTSSKGARASAGLAAIGSAA